MVSRASMSTCTVTINKKGQPSRSYQVRRGLGFQALCSKHQTVIEFGCRNADCGVCILKVIAGLNNFAPAAPKELDFLRAMRADDDERLACQSRVMGDVSVEVDD